MVERFVVLAVSIALIVGWIVTRRFLGKGQQPGGNVTLDDPAAEVETWLRSASQHLEVMDQQLRIRREAEWAAMTRKQRLSLSRRFIESRFGEVALRLYREDEMLRFGSMWYAATDHSTVDESNQPSSGSTSSSSGR